MTTGIFSIGITGLRVAQLGLLTTEHNIANASTPGFSRQRTIQASNIPIATGSGFIGQGASVSTIERIHSQFLTNQVNSAQSSVSELETFYTQIKQIDNMLADPSSGLSPALQDFFSGIQQVAANPSSLPARQAMISSAQTMVARFQGIESRLRELDDSVDEQITTTVGTINSYAQQVADLNQQIVLAQAGSQQPANDLLDQRDQLVAELNKLVQVRTTTNTDGTYNVFFGTGQQLVVGNRANTLAATASSADSSRIAVGIQTAGTVQELPEHLITGGTLAGLLRFRSESLDRATNEMGRVAASLALTFNAQYGLGQDLLGQMPAGATAEFFKISDPKVIANVLNSGPASVPANPTPAAVTATFVSPPPQQGLYTLARTGAASYTLTLQSDPNQTWTAASPAALQLLVAGEGVDVSGAALAVGESTPVRSPAADTSNAYTNLTNSDYRLAYDGANYVVTRLSDNKTWSNAALTTLSATVAASEGFVIASSGTFASGDSFIIQPTKEIARNISVNSTIASDPRLIAAAMPMRTSAGAANTGNGQISAGETVRGFAASSLPASGLTLTYDSTANAFTITGALPAGTNVSVSDGTTSVLYPATGSIPYTAGAKISFAGISFTITGTPGNGDTYTIARNAAGVADGRNALALGKLQTQSTMAGGTATYQAAYARMVADNGNKTREIQVAGEAQTSLLKQAQGMRDSMSGVNLDEEAANLIRFQQAYQASAKVIDIGSKLFDVILAIRS